MADPDQTPIPIYVANGRIVAPQGIIEPGHLLMEEGQISAIRDDDLDIAGEVRLIDASEMWVVPGLIDLHTHGLQGHDNMGSELAEAIKIYPSVGVTSFLATTISAPPAEITDSLQQMAAVLSDPPPGARCLGIHLEGPYLSPQQAGMANPDWLRSFSWDELLDWQAAAQGNLKLITVAPELLDSPNTIERLRQAGFIVSAGHTDATFEQLMTAVEAGLSQATHTFNAMRRFHHRRPGPVGAVLAADQLYAEVIADGQHVHPAVLSMLTKVKGTDRVMLVSDSAPMAGLADGQYQWQGQRITVSNDRCQLEDGTLAGAYRCLDAGLRTIVNETDLTIEAAVKMAATTPARALGLTDIGQLRPGMKADVLLLDESLKPVMTIVEGEVRWHQPDFPDW